MVGISAGGAKMSTLIIDADLDLAAYKLVTNDIHEKTVGHGVEIDGMVVKDSEPYCDVINEKTGAAGVTVDSVELKDGAFIPGGDLNMGAYDLLTDDIKESTATHGVDIDGVVNKDSVIVTLDAVGGSTIPKKVSDNLRNSHDAIVSDQTGATYVKQKTITFTYGIKGTLRVKFQRKCNNASYIVYGAVYKNGVLIGTPCGGTQTTYQDCDEDIDVGTIAAGETLELWGRAEHASALVYLQNFRIYYDNEGSAATGVNT